MESTAALRGSPAGSPRVYCAAPAVISQGIPTFPAGEENYSRTYVSIDGQVNPHGQRDGQVHHLKQMSMDSARAQQNVQSPLRHAPKLRNISAIPTGEQLFGNDQSYLGGPVIRTPNRRRDGHSRQVSHMMSVESAQPQQPAFQFAEESYDLPMLPTAEEHHHQGLAVGHEDTDGQKRGHSRHLSQMSHHSDQSFVSAIHDGMPAAPAAELPDGNAKEYSQQDGHSRHLSQMSMKSARTHQSAQGGLSDFKYAQIPDMPISGHEQEDAKGFPFVERPSNESIIIGAFPNDLDPVEHNVCIGLIQESQAGLESLKFQVEVGKHETEISQDKIESLEAEIARLRTKTVQSFSDKQDFRDRIDALLAQVRYLSTLPHNEKYLDKIKMFEAEARTYRETKFWIEQSHAKEIEALKEEKCSLMSKLKATESVYGTEMDRLGATLERERASKNMAVHILKLNEAKVDNLNKALEREHALNLKLQDEVQEYHEWKKEAAKKDNERIHSVTALFESVTTAVRHSNEQIQMAQRGLAELL